MEFAHLGQVLFNLCLAPLMLILSICDLANIIHL